MMQILIVEITWKEVYEWAPNPYTILAMVNLFLFLVHLLPQK